MGRLDETIRQEIIDRLKQRDQTIAMLGSAIAAVGGLVLTEKVDQKFLFSIPMVCVPLALLAMYHDIVVEYLHRYLQAEGVEWEKSTFREEYSLKWAWIYTLLQLLVFVGTGFVALVCNARLAFCDQTWLIPIWLIEAFSLVLVALLLFYTRMSLRHKACKDGGNQKNEGV